MKRFATLFAAAVLSASSLMANASAIQPFGPGTTLLVNGSAVESASIETFSNGFTLTDRSSLLTITYVTTPALGKLPATGIFNVTDICLNTGMGANGMSVGRPCSTASISFTDAGFGAVNLGLALGLGVTESASGNTGTLSFSQNSSVGLESGTLTFVNPVSNSPVPEPGTLALMATGLLGAAGALRRCFAA